MMFPRDNFQLRVRLWIYSSLAILVFAPVASILIGLHLHVRDFKDNDKPSVYTSRTVQLEAVVVAADPKQGILTLDWNFIGEANSACSKTTLSSCTDVNLFFDNNLFRVDQNTAMLSSNPPTSPVFRFNATAFAVTDIIANTPTFRTNLAIFSPRAHHSSLIYYPFDVYSAEIFTFARDASTNETVGVTLARTRGIAVGFKITASSRTDVFIPPGVVDIMVYIERGPLIKAYAIVATIAIWIITLILLLVMVTSVFFGFRQRGEVLVVPVVTLFAFAQLRNTMPGAPAGMGDIVDFVGLLPCLTLLVLSAAFTLGAFILTDPTTEKKRQLSWTEIRRALGLPVKMDNFANRLEQLAGQARSVGESSGSAGSQV